MLSHVNSTWGGLLARGFPYLLPRFQGRNGKGPEGRKKRLQCALRDRPWGSGPGGKEAGRVNLAGKAPGPHQSEGADPAVWAEVVLPLLSPVQNPGGAFSHHRKETIFSSAME